MAKSKQVSVSKAKMADAGAALEAVGVVAAVDGAAGMVAGTEDLAVAKVAARVGVVAVAEGASDLTSAADAASDAERVQELSDLVGAAGMLDVTEGVDMLMKGGNVRAMGAIVGLMSREELERGLELARLAGELGTLGDVLDALDMPVLSEYLAERGQRLQEIAADQLLRYTSTRALAGAIAQAGKDVEAMGEREVEEGAIRLAVSEAAAERSADLYQASDMLAGMADDELAVAVVAGKVARVAGEAGVAEVAAGAEAVGKGEAAVAAGDALQARAKR
jgi:hypothetical protein